MGHFTDISLNDILMDGFSDMVFVVKVIKKEEEVSFNYQFLNRAAFKITGLTKAVIHQPITTGVTPRHGKFLYDQYYRVVKSKEKGVFEDSFLTSEGKKYTKVTLTPLFNDKQECTYIVAIARDITEEKRNEYNFRKVANERNLINKRYQSLFYHHSDAIISFDLEGRVTSGNDAVETITGYKQTEIIGETINMLLVDEEENIHSAKQAFLQAMAGKASKNFNLNVLNKNGHPIQLLLKFVPVIIDQTVVGIYGIFRDITDVLITQEQLQESEERFRIIAEHANDLISLLDNKGNFIYASPSYTDILGFDNAKYIGESFLFNVHTDDQSHMKEVITKAIRKRHSFKVQFRQLNQLHEFIWTEANGSPVFDQQNKLKHMVVLTRDISLQKEYESKLKQFALHDALTGLPNRRYFNQQLREALANYHLYGTKFAVILLDVDNFKSINDVYGHDVGDEVIIELGRRVRQEIRSNDTVARFGGDEIVILLQDVNYSHALAIVERIQKATHAPWHIRGKTFPVTTSMGITIANPDLNTEYSILKNADLALYEAKRLGKDCYFFGNVLRKSGENRE